MKESLADVEDAIGLLQVPVEMREMYKENKRLKEENELLKAWNVVFEEYLSTILEIVKETDPEYAVWEIENLIGNLEWIK